MIPLLKNQFSVLSCQFSVRATSNPLTLTLFVFRVLADHPHYSLAVDDLALIANFLDRCPDLHKSVLTSQLSVTATADPSLRSGWQITKATCSGTQSARDSDRTEKVRPRLYLPAISG